MSSVADLLAGGGKSWTGEKPGDYVEGTVLTAEPQQQTDLDTDEPVFWDPAKTRPKMMVVVTLQTEEKKDDEDDGKRTIYCSGNKFTALQKSGAKDLMPGDYLKFIYDGESDREPKKRGHNPAKLYTAVYKQGAGKGVSLGEDGPVATTGAQTASATPSGSAAHGAKPDNIPQAAWDVMPAEARAAVAPPTTVVTGPQKPDFLPQAAWDAMSDEQKKAVAG